MVRKRASTSGSSVRVRLPNITDMMTTQLVVSWDDNTRVGIASGVKLKFPGVHINVKDEFLGF